MLVRVVRDTATGVLSTGVTWSHVGLFGNTAGSGAVYWQLPLTAQGPIAHDEPSITVPTAVRFATCESGTGCRAANLTGVLEASNGVAVRYVPATGTGHDTLFSTSSGMAFADAAGANGVAVPRGRVEDAFGNRAKLDMSTTCVSLSCCPPPLPAGLPLRPHAAVFELALTAECVCAGALSR